MISGLTTSFRFSGGYHCCFKWESLIESEDFSFRTLGQLNADIQKLIKNMVPPSRLHFFTSNFAPTITREECAEHPVLTVPELTQALFNVRERSYSSVATTFRGQVSIREVDEYMSSDANNKFSQFVFSPR